MPNVAFIRPELARLFPQYKLIRDCIAGETTIKDRGTDYLPMPNPADTSAENRARYKSYKERAVFYNVARRTLAGLIGQVFITDPQIDVPILLTPVVNNATGTGVSLVQEAKKSLSLTLAYSRCGLLVDYPEAPDGATMQDIQEGAIRPTITAYGAMEIINWRVIDVGAEEILALVVIAELYPFADDGFELKNAMQFRVLQLNQDMQYVATIWREPQPQSSDGTKLPKNGGNYQLTKTYMPKDKNGNPLNRIPFMFIGTENNDPNPDNPNFYDLCSLNVAHYRNSADYEESCYIVGQPTPVVTGLTSEWLKDELKGVLNFGSRGGIPLPEGCTATLLQAEPNTMLKEAMDGKERQMVALGAKLVEQQQVQRTAFEAKMESTSEGSVLSTTAKNVGEAFEWALNQCAQFVAVDGKIAFSLNTDFDIARMTVEERQETMKEWQSGAITFKEMRNVLRKAGTATEDDDAAKAEIDKETADAAAAAAQAMQGAGNDPTINQNNIGSNG